MMNFDTLVQVLLEKRASERLRNDKEIEKFIKIIFDAFRQAIDNPEVLVKITLDTKVEYKMASILIDFMMEKGLGGYIDIKKTRDGKKYNDIIELKNGSAIQFIFSYERDDK